MPFKTFVVVPNTITFRSNALFLRRACVHVALKISIQGVLTSEVVDFGLDCCCVQLLLLEVELILLQYKRMDSYKSLNPNLLSACLVQLLLSP